MANALYNTYKQALLDPAAGANSDAPDLNTDAIDLSLHSSTYTFSAAHSGFDETSGQIDSQSVQVSSPTVTNGVFDAADTTFTTVAGGSTLDAYIVYEDTGVAATSQLIAYFDTDASGAISLATNGGDVVISHNASGIFSL